MSEKIIPNNQSAEFFYHKKPERYNCAQAILCAFQNEFNISDEIIEQYRAKGAGRAPEGYCGALYSAMSLNLPNDIKQQMENDFKEIAGSLFCREIRKLKNLSCKECVILAEKLVNEALVTQD